MSDQNNREEIYSRPVRAGKRTYFFDVKATRGQDLYMTITESKRRFDDDGNVHYQKHKIFLYREDFNNFEEGFLDAVGKIEELMATGDYRDPIAERQAKSENEPVTNEVESDGNKDDSDDFQFDDL
jgi:hypothetical protein